MYAFDVLEIKKPQNMRCYAFYLVVLLLCIFAQKPASNIIYKMSYAMGVPLRGRDLTFGRALDVSAKLRPHTFNHAGSLFIMARVRPLRSRSTSRLSSRLRLSLRLRLSSRLKFFFPYFFGNNIGDGTKS